MAWSIRDHEEVFRDDVSPAKRRMKLPHSAHTTRAWRIHEVAYDFKLLDVWALPTPGGPDDFPLLVEWATSLDPTETSSVPVRALFEIRRKLGELFGWDDPSSGVGGRVS